MKEKKAWQVLDGTTLKLIAMVSMVFDHVGDNFFPQQLWMRVIGRMALPIFAFCVAEGFCHTRDRKKYLLRMGVFACLSEIPFDLVTAGKLLEFGHQNIMLTFFWAILGLLCYQALWEKKSGAAKAFAVAALLFFAGASLLLGLDYNLLAVGLIFLFVLLRKLSPEWRNAAAMAFHALLRNKGLYWFGLLGFLPLFLYNGRKGRGLKWLFYVFYPGHLLLIWLIRTLLN